MDWIKQMNESINYIEDNLDENIDVHEVARIACCSVYHFQRMFSYIVDVPLSEYIRRRRLSLAALALQQTDIKVIDLALQYGYESPDSFSRAFSRLHGVTPSQARQSNTVLKIYPKISLVMQIKGGIEMNFRIIEKEAFKVCGKSFTIKKEDDPYKRIPEFWEDIQKDGTYQKICEAVGVKPYSGYSLSGSFYDYPEDESYRCKYLIFASISDTAVVSEELETLSVPKSQWVVFSQHYTKPEESTEMIQGIWKRIYSEWFPSVDYEAVAGLSMEVFPANTNTVEVWIPIKKK